VAIHVGTPARQKPTERALLQPAPLALIDQEFGDICLAREKCADLGRTIVKSGKIFGDRPMAVSE